MSNYSVNKASLTNNLKFENHTGRNVAIGLQSLFTTVQ